MFEKSDYNIYFLEIKLLKTVVKIIKYKTNRYEVCIEFESTLINACPKSFTASSVFGKSTVMGCKSVNAFFDDVVEESSVDIPCSFLLDKSCGLGIGIKS